MSFTRTVEPSYYNSRTVSELRSEFFTPGQYPHSNTTEKGANHPNTVDYTFSISLEPLRMGFVRPAKSKKRLRTPSSRPSKRQKKDGAASTSSSECPSATSSRPTTPAQGVTVEVPTGSILERLPVEILQEVFVFSGVSSLPLTCKSINRSLRPSHSLRLAMLKTFVYDLNCKVRTDAYKTAFALDRDCLQYKFVNSKVLKEINFDIVLPMRSIVAESKNRLMLHYDSLNKRLLETLYLNNADADEINRELARMTEERSSMDDIQTEDLPSAEEFEDYPERFYTHFSQNHIEMAETLYNTGMRFKVSGKVMSMAISEHCDVETLSRILKCTETGTITSVEPVISAFANDDLATVEWLLEMKAHDTDLINNDDLWIWIGQKKRTKFLKFLTDKGANPSHGIIGAISNNLHG